MADGGADGAMRRTPSPRKVAAALVGNVLVARGSCGHVADALRITTRTLRRYVRAGRSSDGLRCVVFPAVYSLIDTDRVEEVAFGTAETLARKLSVDEGDVVAAARTGAPLKGLLVADKTVEPMSYPYDRICALRAEYAEREMSKLDRERRMRRSRQDG